MTSFQTWNPSSSWWTVFQVVGHDYEGACSNSRVPDRAIILIAWSVGPQWLVRRAVLNDVKD